MSESNADGTSRVWVFEEDPEMRELISELIRSEGFRVVDAMKAGIREFSVSFQPHDLLVSTGGFSDEGGRLFREILQGSGGLVGSLRVLLLCGPEEARLPKGLAPAEIQAIHFFRRPFERAVLLGKIRALLEGGAESAFCLRVGQLRLDLRSEDVECEGVAVRLTASEFRLLRELMENAGRVLSRERLIQKVQGEGVAVVDRAIDTHVVSLRKKLGSQGERIETIRGEGYLFRS